MMGNKASSESMIGSGAAQAQQAAPLHQKAESAPHTEQQAKVYPSCRSERFDDDYRILQKIGEGNFGQVYTCAHRREQLVAAVKIISRRHMSRRDKRHLEDEIAVMGELDHPHIVQLYGVYQSESCIHIVMELCTGGELFDRIVARRRYSESDARELVRRMLDAVAHAHAKGVVHRDLKPENVLLARKESDVEIKLADWGLAHYILGIEVMKTVCGSPSYMAPEVVDEGVGQGNGYTEKADVWSVGVITFILLAGYNLFDDLNMGRMVAKIRACRLVFPEKSFNNVSEEAKDLLKHVIVRDPRKRLTARACLEHDWFRMGKDQLVANDLGETRERLVSLRARRRFRAVVDTIRLANRFSMAVNGRSLSSCRSASASGSSDHSSVSDTNSPCNTVKRGTVASPDSPVLPALKASANLMQSNVDTNGGAQAPESNLTEAQTQQM